MSDYAPSFGSLAETYERARPRTGKLTQQLVARGVDVVALEPDPDMQAVLRRVLPDVELHEGFAEDIPLADASVDAITVGQAFHWFDGERPPFGERPGIAEKRSFRQRRPMTVDAIVEWASSTSGFINARREQQERIVREIRRLGADHTGWVSIRTDVQLTDGSSGMRATSS